jgi:uncharacterized protein (DUF1330 family)
MCDPGESILFCFPKKEELMIAPAKKWLNSTEYTQPQELSHQNATSNMVVIDGV